MVTPTSGIKGLSKFPREGKIRLKKKKKDCNLLFDILRIRESNFANGGLRFHPPPFPTLFLA